MSKFRLSSTITKFCAGIACLGATLYAGTPRAEIVVNTPLAEAKTLIEEYIGQNIPNCSATQRDLDRQFANVEDQSRTAMDALGYYFAAIGTSLNQTGDCWRLRIDVDPGPQTTVANWTLAIRGPLGNHPLATRLQNGLPRSGTLFLPSRYEQRKREVIDLALAQGFVDARYATSSVVVDDLTHRADVEWVIESGPPYAIGEITIKQDVLHESLFAQYLTLEEGAPYRNADLLATYESLVSSDFFSQVSVEPKLKARTNGRIPVTVNATKADQWSVLAGPGFATDSGPRLRGSVQAKYLNRAGHRGGFDTLLSPVTSYLSAEYRWPYGDPRHQWYTVKARAGVEDTDTAKSSSFNLGLYRTQRLSRRWTQTLSVDYLVEDFDISTEEGRAQLLLFGHSLTYTSSINEPRPRRGRTLSLDVKAGAQAALSDTDVVQARITAKQILPLPFDARVLVRGQIGYSWQDAFADLPASLRFFAGGDNSVRGFALDELGPIGSSGEVIGGSRLITGSVEIDFPVRQNWSAALFTDVGSAFDDSPEFSQSIGVGARWYSPLGPIRLDLAHPLEDSSQTVRIHISIGPDL